MEFTENEQKTLDEISQKHNTVDYTDLIRMTKCGDVIKIDVEAMEKIVQKHAKEQVMSEDELTELLKKECNFMYTHCTHMFNLLKKGTMDFAIMYKILDCFKEIENGTLNQHQFAYKCGMLLKEIYIDGVISKKEEEATQGKLNQDEQDNVGKKQPINTSMTWSSYKKTHLTHKHCKNSL